MVLAARGQAVILLQGTVPLRYRGLRTGLLNAALPVHRVSGVRARVELGGEVVEI